MEATELATALNGHEYGAMPKQLAAAAKEAGLVIVTGYSDDGIQFLGAIRDEADTLGGGTVLVDRRGPLPSRSCMDDADDDELRDWLARKASAATIEARWGARGEPDWSYVTDLPHETFMVVDEGEAYCRGLVLRLADLPGI